MQGVSLALHRHEVVGLIGPNGAGKSTLVNLLTGFDLPTSGSVELDGRDITRWSASRRGRHGLARTFQHSHPFRSLSVRENVEVAALGVGASPGTARGPPTSSSACWGSTATPRRRPVRSPTGTSVASASRARSRRGRPLC